MPVGALMLFGGETLQDFAFALLVGVASGAYSSIFIAAPVLTLWKEREPVYVRRRKMIMAENDGHVPPFASGTIGDEPSGGAAAPGGRRQAPRRRAGAGAGGAAPRAAAPPRRRPLPARGRLRPRLPTAEPRAPERREPIAPERRRPDDGPTASPSRRSDARPRAARRRTPSDRRPSPSRSASAPARSTGGARR